jgi:hypothetical protein
MDRNRIYRTYVVAKAGTRDASTIQAAIDEAHASAPDTDSPFLVLVMPGLYKESLTLYDNIHVVGYGSAKDVVLQYGSSPAIETIANARLQNLTIIDELNAGDYTILPAAITGNVPDRYEILIPEDPPVLAAVSPTLTLHHVYFGRPEKPGQEFLELVEGKVRLENCFLTGGQYENPLIEVFPNTEFYAWRTLMQTITAMASPTRGVVQVDGGIQDVNYCRIEEPNGTGLHALYFITDAPTLTRWHHCSFHGGGVAAIAENVSATVAATFGHCAANITRSGTYSGMHDIVINTGV